MAGSWHGGRWRVDTAPGAAPRARRTGREGPDVAGSWRGGRWRVGTAPEAGPRAQRGGGGGGGGAGSRGGLVPPCLGL